MQRFRLIKKLLVFGIFFILLFSGFTTFTLIYAEGADNTDDLVFIHHSVGNNWLNAGLHDALLAKSYIDERNDIYYGTDMSPDSGRPDSLSPTPGDKTNMNHWILWFNDYFEGIKNQGCDDGFNKIIMFKSCYPISNIGSDGTEPGDPFSSSQNIANYKAVYRNYNGPGETYTHNDYTYKPLEDIFSDNPDVLFIPVTAPPRHYAPTDATNDAEAHRARIFNNWLKNDWLEEYNTDNPGINNVAVYDWFDFLSYSDNHPDHPNRLKSEYGGESGNSHPNTQANEESTEDFATNDPNFIDTAWDAYASESGDIVISYPSPSNGETDVSVNLSELSVNIIDPEGDNFNWAIETSPNIGSASSNDESNGTKYCYISGLNYDLDYIWYVNATDNSGESSGAAVYMFTTVKETGPDPKPDLYCSGSLHWTGVKPGSTVPGSFTVENIGDSGSLLDWTVESYPSWGTWTFDPENGEDVSTDSEPVMISVEIVIPDEQNQQYNGEVKIVNLGNSSDYEIISVSVSTPKIKENHNFDTVPIPQNIPQELPVKLEYNITSINEFVQSIFECFPIFYHLFFMVPFFRTILNQAIFILIT